jgi:hypothetical protein
MIYTSYEMMRDCRSNLAVGRRHFVRQYVPTVKKMLAHYGAENELERLLTTLSKPESLLFQAEPVPERPFVAELRQAVMAELAAPPAELELELEALAKALESLTLVEKQVVWLEGMRYTLAETGEMLRMSPATVEKIRGRAGELIRAQVDHWNARLVSENGRTLGREAAAKGGAECLGWKTFLDIVDGRMAWLGREQMERHVHSCWHCIDHFCRLLEVVELLRGLKPLTEEEAAPFDKLLGIEAEKKTGWRKWLGS